MSESVVRIEKLAFGGAGFGRIDGKACFVPYTAPGDTARIRVVAAKRSYLEGELLELLEPTERRVAPECPIFGICGGCNWQHLTYPDQLAAKEEIFAELLWRSGRVERERIMPIAPALQPYGYRSRVQLKVRCIAGELMTGFYRAGSHFVVNIPEKCAIVHPVINRLISGLRRVLALFPEADKIPQIDAAIGDDGKAELVIHYFGGRDRETGKFFSQNRLVLGAEGILLQTGRKATLERIAGEDCRPLTYSVPNRTLPDQPDLRLSFGSGGFSQVNYQQNLTLIETVCEWAGLTGRERVLDIYCGNGNFSLPLAGNAAEVVGVEDYDPSISMARQNATANGLKNISFICADAVAFIERMVSAGGRYDVVLLDPPRSGAAEVIRNIPALKPKAVLYVSCDPSTLARDIGILKKFDYDVVKCRPVDMFPQTYHIESVTLLAAAGGRG